MNVVVAGRPEEGQVEPGDVDRPSPTRLDGDVAEGGEHPTKVERYATNHLLVVGVSVVDLPGQIRLQTAQTEGDPAVPGRSQVVDRGSHRPHGLAAGPAE